MQWIITLSGGKNLMLEDHGEKNLYLKVSIVDTDGATIVLGVVEKNDLKRLGKSL